MSPATGYLIAFLGYYAAMLLLWALILQMLGPECGGSDPVFVYGWSNGLKESLSILLAALVLPVLLGMMVCGQVYEWLAQNVRRSARDRRLDARTQPPPPRRGCSW